MSRYHPSGVLLGYTLESGLGLLDLRNYNTIWEEKTEEIEEFCFSASGTLSYKDDTHFSGNILFSINDTLTTAWRRPGETIWNIEGKVACVAGDKNDILVTINGEKEKLVTYVHRD
jgi:hypothetical protein